MNTNDQHSTIAGAVAGEFRQIGLSLEAASVAALAPFGTLLARPEGANEGSDYYVQLKLSRPVDFRCDHPVELALATLARREGMVRYLERHFSHTQTFIPLGGKPFVMVLAPPSNTDLPDLSKTRAFRFEGTQGFALHVGTWHEFPFAIAEGTDIVVVMSTQTGYDLTGKHPDTQEAFGPDLDKKDIARRTGVILRVDLDSQPVAA